MSADQNYCMRCGKKVTEDMNYCSNCGFPLRKTVREEYSVSSDELIEKIKKIIHEGNVTRIIVKNEKGELLLEMPVTVGVIGTILAPSMAALGVIAAIATRCSIVVERIQEKGGDGH